ncbi:SWIM zinc finger family protein [Nocardioides sp. 616]|uniref:SWIM zinc finger family protein n=1 Tax=Nocardioides sp. 616 TaxID=2268090 RepID=UPI000CE54BFC|nr:SWIM zinc finger family protein [Nocardioides sp. 616]
MSRWSEKQVRDVAPDAASLSAAARLATPAPWRDTGCNDVLVWGKCQGSGKSAYQVSVDLTGPAYRCSCPSRKFPCKHGLALLMLWSRGALDESGQVADFAQEWAGRRAEKAERTQEAPDRAPADPAAAAKRLEQRLALMSAGIDDFRRWLGDVARSGLAAARSQPYAWWDGTAARLVDSQLPGLAEQVRTMGSQVHAREDWAEHLLDVLGRWWTITCAWQDRDNLSEDETAELRVVLGWAQAAAEVRAGPPRPGPWLVLGAHRSDEGKVQQQRTWLRGPDGEVVQVLDFAGYGEVVAVPQLSGALLDVAVARYPGHPPRRAVFAGDPTSSRVLDSLPGRSSVADALAAAAATIATVPWRDRHPVLLGDVTVAPADAGRPAYLRDDAGHVLPLVEDAPVWLLLALSGGAPLELFGELEDGRFRPLTAVGDGQVTAL